jgi:transcription elongation GreA/GreB family factor
MTVTVRRDDGRKQSFKIVGEDEADPSYGTVSYVSPLARSRMVRARRLCSPTVRPSF